MILDDWFISLAHLVTKERVLNFIIALIMLFGGIFISGRSRMAVQRLPQLDNQQKVLMTKLTYYVLIGLTIAATMSQLGFDLKVILGAAGILTVAVGFAAQTSASNLISGIFLMVERPFLVGDVINVAGTTGEVISVDLLSSKIRTFANLMVRIPNETLVKSNIVNYSYFPVRRVDFTIGVGYNSDITRVEQVLRSAAMAHPLCLEDPKPIYIFSGFGDSAMNIQFQVFTLTANMTQLQNELYRDIKVAFDRNQIDIPFPTRILVQASQPNALHGGQNDRGNDADTQGHV